MYAFRESGRKSTQRWMQEDGRSPEEVAEFLREGPCRFQREGVGEALGCPEKGADKMAEAPSKLCQAYVATFADGFRGARFMQAFRWFLGVFALPKESQQIDRVLSSFAQVYFAMNSNS